MTEIVDIQRELQEKWLILWLSLGLGLIACIVAWRQGFFNPFHASPFPLIRE